MQFLKKTKKFKSIKLNIRWSDLGNWREISKMYLQNRITNTLIKKIFTIDPGENI